MSDRFSIIDNMSEPRIKSRVIAQLGALQGIWRVELCRYRPRRSDRQNRYYWPCFVAPFAAYLVEQGNQFRDPETAAHEILKASFLKVAATDRKSGKRMPYLLSTTQLTTAEFNDYLDQCAAMLAEECGIVVPDPSIYHEKEDSKCLTTTNA